MKLSRDRSPEGTVRDWLGHRAETQGDVDAYLFCDDSAPLSWTDLQSRAGHVAQHLIGLGAQKGESIAIMMPNGRDAVLALFGALVGGYRATIINLAAGQDAIAYALEHCEARFAFVGDAQMIDFGAVAPAQMARLPSPDVIGQSDAMLPDLEPDDHALLMYTSGTTGRPKGVVHTHKSLLAGGWTPTIAHDLSREDRGLCVLPICHINGLCVTVMGTLVSGGSLVIAPKFSATRFWETCRQSRVTWFSVVPTIISHLLHGQTDPDADTQDRLRFGRSASSALAPDVQTAFESRFGVPIIETMGLTETAAQILSNPLPPGVRKIGSPGKAFGNDVAILSAGLTPLAPDHEGEIAVRGPNVMLEYLKNPEATTASFAGDWLRTGDLGKIDSDGYVYVTGRLKELIIKGGENVAPREIDEALYSHPDVIEAAAFARPCESYGERIEAAVAVKSGSALRAEDLIRLCVKRVGQFKAPDAVYFLEDLPKGPSGKIQRMKLAAITGA